MSFLVTVFPFHSCQVIRTLQQAIPECSSNQALAYANTVDREVREKYYLITPIFTSPEATNCFSIITLMIIRENKIIDQFLTPKHKKIWLPF